MQVGVQGDSLETALVQSFIGDYGLPPLKKIFNIFFIFKIFFI